MSVRTLAIFLFTAGALPHVHAAEYKGYEAMVPMRDGTKLYTVYFVPQGQANPSPILLERTPYGAGNPNRAPGKANGAYGQAAYIFAYQDVRGRGNSEGEFVNVRPILPKGKVGIDETTDTYDTVEFLIKNVPNNSQRVGLTGISYPAFYAGAAGIRNHPAIKAISPQAPVNDWFMGDDVAHRGVMFTQENFDFSIGFDVAPGKPRPQIDREGLSAYDFFLKAGAPSTFEQKFMKGSVPYWQELVDHDTYDAYWKERALWRAFKDVKCAVLTVGGFFDKEDMWGALNLYKAGERQNRGTPNFLVMGPWSHGQWSRGPGTSLGGLTYPIETGTWYRENVEFPFFERYLRGRTDVPAPAEATIYDTGANRFEQFTQWPPKGLKKSSVYLAAGSTVARTAAKTVGTDRFTTDPMKPTPYLEDRDSKRAPGDWLARNQKFLDGRADTLTYRLPAFETDWRVAGPITADVWFQTTGTDADLVVQVIDEYPADGSAMAGFQLMVRGEIMRAKFRQSFERPIPIRPGEPTRVKFELNDVLHTFRKGHRLAIRIMSTWFPIAERNPNQFLSRAATKDTDYRKAEITILHGGAHASRVEFGAMN